MKTTISNGPIKVLLIDDDEDDYLLTRDLMFELKAGQYQLEWISNYVDGLLAVTRNEHHVCLIDYRLGTRSGTKLISQAREQGCRIPMILLTRENAHDIDVEALSSGAEDYLVKGQTNAALLERTIRYAVNRRQVEEKLRESEERLKAQYKGLPVPTYTWRKIGDDFVLTDYNNAAVKITQGNISRLIGTPLEKLYDDNPQIINNFNRCFNTQNNIQDDIEYRFKSTGETKQLDVSYVFIPPDIVMIHTRDVTEQKQIEATLRLQKTLLESQSEASIEGILVHNSVGKIISRNRRFAEMWGYSEEMLATGAREAILKAGFNQVVDRRGYMKLVAYLDLHPKEIHQTEIKLKNGRILDLYTAPVIGANDVTYGRVWFFRDITEHKQIEFDLRQSEEKYRELIENANDIIYTLNLSGDFTSLNRAGELITGYTRAEVLARNIADIISPDDVEPVRKRIASNIAGAELPNFELEVIAKNGDRVTLDISSRVIYQDGAIAGIQGIGRDITGRKQAEAALEQSEKDYRTIFEQAHDAIIVLAPEGEVILDVNQRACNLYGFSRSEFIGMSMEVISKNPARGREKVKETLKTGEYVNFETQQFRKDGSEMFIEANASPIIYQGELAIITINRDITERKLVENKLRLSEANLAAAQRITHLGSWEVELSDLKHINNNKVHWSDEVYRIFGYEPGQFEPSIKLYFSSTHEDDRRRSRKSFFEAIIYRKNLDIEFRVVLPDNSERILHGQAEIIYDEQSNEPLKLIGTVQDITESRRAKVALLEANEKAIREYERLLERIAQLAATLGNARDLQTIYRALYAFSVISLPCTGFFISLYDPHQEMRIPVYACSDGEEYDVSKLPPIGMTDSPNSRAVSTGAIIIENDFQKATVHKPIVNIGLENNPDLPQSSLAAPMSVMGRIVGAVEVQSTERASYTKEHATAMQMAANLAANAIENVRLLEQEREKDEQLRQAQKLESVGRLAGGIAHDFNNMLTAINGYSDLTLRRLGDADPLRRNIEEIKKAGERSASLTHQLLAFSRQQILQPIILDINEVIVETIEMLKRLIGEDIHLITKLNHDLSYVKADPGQLTQVIMNLLVNARDAMPKGGNLIIETKNVYLDEDFAAKHIPTQPGFYILLSVRDTGIGMTAEDQKNIFEPFYTTKDIGKGTGLGLATVYGIIKQSDGYIWVDSEVDKGTTFQIYLPPADAESAAKEIQGVSDESACGAERILLVEDEDLVRNLSREMLETCGYEVIEASSGVEALRIFKQIDRKIDLLLTDVVMPQMGGRELAENLIDLQPNIKVIFTSGYTDDSIVRHGVNEADINFIQKPFTFDKLINKVRDVLDTPQTGN